jgi:hypothetical protein
MNIGMKSAANDSFARIRTEDFDDIERDAFGIVLCSPNKESMPQPATLKGPMS